MRVYKDLDLATQEVTAYHFVLEWLTPLRTIYLDGRPHPGPSAPHTWGGFSTGEWKDGALVVKTTHMKVGYIRRIGVPTSDQATMVEYFRRHGDYLSHVSIINDPIYLSEPLVRSTNWLLTPDNVLYPQPCRPAIEIAAPEGTIPHHLPWEANPMLDEFAVKFGLPQEAADGGAQTLYPEFMHKLPQPR
jgi:hypothetical protein